MALSDKNIVITPNIGSSTDDPKIVFTGASASAAAAITLRAYPINGGMLSFEGSAGQLLSITNDLGTLNTTIYSVNDVSGIPSFEILADGTVRLAQFNGNVGVGVAAPVSKLHVSGTTGTTFTLEATSDGSYLNLRVGGQDRLKIGNAGGVSYIDHNYANYLLFKTSGTERARLDANGFSVTGTLGVSGAATIGGALTLPAGIWVQSPAGQQRLYFASGGITYFGAQAGYEWRSAADAKIAEMSNTGVFNAIGGLQVNGVGVSLTSHDHTGSYLPIGGGTLTGPLTVPSSSGPYRALTITSSGADTLNLGQVASGYSYIGSSYYQNSNLWRSTITSGAVIKFRPDAVIEFLADTGLTAGVDYTPTVRASLSAGGIFNAIGGLQVNGTSVSLVGHTHSYEPTISAGTTSQWWRGDKTWQSLPSTLSGLGITAVDVTGQLLTNYAVGTNTALAATDTILGAFNKVQAQLNNKQASGSYLTANQTITLSGDITGSGTTAITTTYNGVVPVAKGGTNISSYAVGDLLYASAATTLSKLADVATGNALISGGVTTAPSWGKIGLTTHISGTLAVANGGTGATTISAATSAFFNNSGQPHSTQTDFNAIADFGARFVQGTTNGPGTGASQFYSLGLGLGSEYTYANYALQLAFPRYTTTDRYISMRNREGTTWGAWQKIYAGYADTAGNISGSGIVAVANGGTGIASYTAGDLIIATAGTTLAKLAIGTTGKVLTVVAGAPAWADAAGGGATLADDTSTAALYPVMSTATTGTFSAAKVSSTKLSFNASTGNLGLGLTPSARLHVKSAAANSHVAGFMLQAYASANYPVAIYEATGEKGTVALYEAATPQIMLRANSASYLSGASAQLTIGSNTNTVRFQVNGKPSYDNSHTYDTNAMMVTHPTATATATLNDPKPALYIAREGTTAQCYGAAASFAISRYEADAANSRTRLDIGLAHEWFTDVDSNYVMTLLSSGSVGIGLVPSVGARLHIQGATSGSSAYGLVVQDSSLNNLLYVRDDGYIYFGHGATEGAHLDTSGNLVVGGSVTGTSFIGNATNVTGIVAVVNGGTGVDASSTAANYVFASPNGSTGAPTFRALVAADVPNLDTGKMTSGTLGVARGGTGLASYTIGDILYASGQYALSALADVAAGNVLTSGGVATAPAWGKVGLTTHVSGTLGLGNGGTGSTDGSITGTGALAFTAGGTNTNITLTPNGTGYTLFNGTVGVGGANQGQALTVIGTAGAAAAAIGVWENSTGTNKRLVVTQAAAAVTYDATYSSGGNTHAWLIGGTQYMTMIAGGKVGIGVAAPDSKLHVQDASDITPGATGLGQFTITGNGYNAYIALDATALHFGHNSGARALHLQTDETDRLMISAAGIITVTSELNSNNASQFDINSAVSTSAVVRINRTGGTGGFIVYAGNTATANLTLTDAGAMTVRGLVTATGGFSGAGTSLTGTASSLTAGAATNAANVGITDDTSTNATYYPTFVTSNTGNLPMKTSSSKLTYNPSTGMLTATDFTASSDERLKKDIETIPDALAKVLDLRGVGFVFKDDHTERRRLGVIAQEVRKVLPEAVFEDKNGVLSVAYGSMVGALIEAIKGQHKIISSLEERLSRLEKLVN